MTDKVRGFFDRYSEGFNAIYGHRKSLSGRIIDTLFRKSMLMRFQKTLESCKPLVGKSVLDIGCGPGHYAIALAEAGAKNVLGIDFAPNMIELANGYVLKTGLENNCIFKQLDFMQMDDGKKYDYIVVMGVMDYIGKPLPFIRKAVQMCSGKVLLSFPVKGGFLAWQRKLRYRFKCPLFLYSEEQIRNQLFEIGIADFTIERIQRDYFVTIKVNSL